MVADPHVSVETEDRRAVRVARGARRTRIWWFVLGSAWGAALFHTVYFLDRHLTLVFTWR